MRVPATPGCSAGLVAPPFSSKLGAGEAACKALPCCLLLCFKSYQGMAAAQDRASASCSYWHTAGSLRILQHLETLKRL